MDGDGSSSRIFVGGRRRSGRLMSKFESKSGIVPPVPVHINLESSDDEQAEGTMKGAKTSRKNRKDDVEVKEVTESTTGTCIISRKRDTKVPSDDDFVTPPKKIATTHKQLKENKMKLPRKKSTDGASKKVNDIDVKKNVGVICNTKELRRVRIRSPPICFYLMTRMLTDAQRNSVKELGFGSLLKFEISELPTKMGYWVLQNFDADRCSLKIGDKSLIITTDTVHDVFGIPKGNIRIKPFRSTCKTDKVTSEWRKQFSLSKKRIYINEIVDLMTHQKEGGDLFKLNYLVVFVTTMIEVLKCGTVNQKFLPCIKDLNFVKNMNWCSYLLDCLKQTKIEWNEERNFNGPLIFLVVSN